LERITAQQPQVAPQPAVFSSFAKHKNKFFIYGGTIDGKYEISPGSLGQFFALDLSKPWTSESPSWIQLPTGPRASFGRGAISLDGTMFAGFPYGNRQPNLFSFDTKVWSPSKAVIVGSDDSAPVTLGTDGTVLIPGEFSPSSNRGVYNIYSFDGDNALNTPSPPPSAVFNSTQFFKSTSGEGGVWSQYLKSAVYYGGYSPEFLPNFRGNLVVTYHPESKTWEQKVTNGGDDTSLIDAGKTSTPVNIYQISTGTWVSEYTPSAEYLDPVPVQPSKTVLSPSPSSAPSPSSDSSPSTPSTEKPSDAKPNIGIIAGGTVGGIAAVALIGYLVWMRKKRGSRHRHHHDDLPSDTDHSSHQKESKVEMHVTSRVIQTPSRVAALHPPQYPYGSDDVDDGTADNRHSTKDAKLYSTRRATRSPPPGPQSHLFGTNMYNSYAADGSQYSDTTIAPPHSALSAATTYGYELPHYSPSSSSRSGPGSRNPQTLGHSHMTRGKWTEERPGPQWQP
ncbi:hypothetical protein DFQ27_004686, partial [Actinomortierella ambigua]